MTYAQRVEREDEGDRLRSVLQREAHRSDSRIRAAMHDVASGLMAWSEAPELSARQYRRLEDIGRIYRPEGKETLYGRSTYADPYDTDLDDWGV